MSPTPELVGLATLVVLGAYFVFGLTGFGSTVLALPLLAQLAPLKFVVPLLMLLDLAAFLAVGVRGRRGIRVDELGRVLPFALIGMALGLTLLIQVAEAKLLVGLGVFVLAYALWGLLRRGPAAALPRWSCVPIGTAGGALSALFGTGGVLFAIYNAGRISDKGELRASNAAMIAFSGVVRIVMFGATGLLAQEGLWLFALLLLPALFVGLALGSRLHAVVPAQTVVRAVHAVLVLAGVAVLVRAFAG
ncbi:MAG: sulfite exporter TauE/SafE family protein [Proteobacteria bacterium]|nr:sulfite exporter TauE/SafE family protein [Pseudomonadota bacterium]